MELTFKKTLTALLSAILFTAVYAESSFVGFTGISLDVQPDENTIVEVYADGVIAGQYSINDTVIFKGNFQFSTGDIISHGFFYETPASFSIRELSATYNLYGKDSLMHISAVIGEQGVFGSDSFTGQYLGVRNFSSSLLTPLITPVTAGMTGFSGLGLSFIDDFGSSALGVSASCNRDEISDNAQINADIQYAFQSGNTVFDTTAGVTAPIEETTASGGTKYVLPSEIKVRAGISTLFSISDRMNLFFQAGISGVKLPYTNPVKLDQLFLFVEPRLSLPVCNVNISFFCLSDTALKNLAFVSKPLGCNLNVQTLPFFMFNHTACAGIDITAAADRKPDTSSTDGVDMSVIPYLDCSLATGTINTAIAVHPFLYDDVSKFIRISFSYKAQF